LAECGLKFPISPRAVRKYKVEESPFLTRFLLLEQFMGPAGKFEKSDTFIDVGLVGCLVFLNVSQQTVLLSAPLCRLAVEEDRVYTSRQCVSGACCILSEAGQSPHRGSAFHLRGFAAMPQPPTP
jgi:hypothetical protein